MTTQTTSGTLAQAHAALRSWQYVALFDLAQQLPIARYTSSVLPDDITDRIHRALQGCTNAEEVKMVFAQVQDGQLV